MKHAPREHQRVYLTYYLRVFEEDDFIGFLIDISSNGMMIMSESPLTVEKFYRLKMKFPSCRKIQESGAVQEVEFTARCIWIKQDEDNEEFYLAGFEITEIDEEDNACVHKLIEEYRLK